METSAAACRKLGGTLARRGDWGAALDCYRRAAGLEPAEPETWFEWGTAFYLSGDAANAQAAYTKALSLAVDLPRRRRAEYWYRFGVAAMHRGEAEQAYAAFEYAVKLDPQHARARNNIGLLRQIRGDHAEAERAYRAALRADPRSAEARYNLALSLQQRDAPGEALSEYEKLVAAEPRHVDALTNLANALTALGRPREALDALDRALAVDPAHVQARWNRALAALTLGDWETGWREYEWRLRQPERPPRSFAQPRWDGAPLDGRRILLWAEQGFGDTIQFLRYAPLVAARGGIVTVECPAALLLLARTVEGVAEAIAAGAELSGFDVHAPLLSLPHLFNTRVETTPARVPYLSAEAPAGACTPGAPLRVGLVWAGSPAHRNDRLRSIDPALLAPLGAVDGVEWVGMQYGAASLPAGFIGESPGARFTGFAATAAEAMTLDLVISVDTAVAHLAGALAIPVWLLVPFAADWRWMTGRDTSPWYPTMRIYRQPARHDWAAVIEEVRRDLAAMC